MCRQYFQISTVQPLTGYLHLLWGWHSVDWQSRECYVRIEAIVYRAFEFRLTQEHIVSVSIRSVSVPRHSVVKRHQTFIMGCVRLHTTWVERDNDTREGEGREKWGTEEANNKQTCTVKKWCNPIYHPKRKRYLLLEIHRTHPKTSEIDDDIRPKDFHFCTALILSAYFNHLNITKGHMQETASVKTNTLIIPSLVKCLPWLSVAISKLLPWFPTIGLVKTPDCVAWNNIFINCFFSGLTLLSGSQFCHM